MLKRSLVFLYGVVAYALSFATILLFAFWSTPHMTAPHLLFAAGTTLYILIAIRLEERDLVEALGEAYAEYRRRVPMLIPLTRARAESEYRPWPSERRAQRP